MPEPLKGAPIVSGAMGHAYLVTEQLHIWALKLVDGTITWKHDEPRNPNEVRCYNALTGSRMWTAEVDGNLIHTPQVGQNVVYVATCQGSLHAFNQTTGKLLWRVSLGGPLTLPAADSSLVVIGSGPSLVGLNPKDGSRVFSIDLGSAIGSIPVLTGDGAYAALGDSVVSVDRSGGVRWRANLLKPAWAPIAVTKSGVIVASVDGGVELLSPASGAKTWETVLVGTPNTVSGAGEVVYVGTRQGTVVGLRLSDGAKLWSAALGHGVIDGMGMSGGRVIVTAGKWVGALLPAPEAPGQVALVQDGKAGRLTWVAPQPNGSAISAYRVWRRRGTNETMLGTTPDLAFAEDLLGGEVGYQVSAVAANGAESTRSAEVTLAKGEPLLRRLSAAPVPLDPRGGSLTVSFDLRENARVVWQVVDAEGRALTDEKTVSMPAGTGSLVWDGRNRSGSPAEPGVYRVNVQATAASETDAQARAVPVVWGVGSPGGSGVLAGPVIQGGGPGAGPSSVAPVSGGVSSGSGPGAAAAGAAGGGHGNNGVRDHGVGEGRDGAGQGKGGGTGRESRK